jgi:hypothetical protein
MRTARSRTSSGYLFVVPISSILSKVGASGKPGAIQRIVVFTRDNGWVGSCDGTRAYNPTDIEALRQLQISMRPNTALLTDTYTSPLHARHGAAERERYAAEADAP